MQPTPFAERVLDLVALVPVGCVTTYGDVAELLGEGGPRGVGAVMARWGGGVPWWRVIRADGTPPPHKAEEALRLLGSEGVRAAGGRVDLRRHRWDGEARQA
ncbi:alkylated DNA nucleotide flippase Atl1 [Motilibacter rhizosphaerae]|uniref:Alkylated DNA nucleotide flippase Atl1 n=1 Tax=Motilibacter rhizosphaerae TaxID=598652 RepID=A0A4Q7NQ28_9ACTN|nr:MGMT family protein [Motilibacter rhizosphaerae]RZS87212.1 alkylated DNA nucleotide flippase Atl1 [Motilibacter rhizosphaerae]